MAIGYFDCFSGASGDMILGALVDAGLSLADLRDALASLRLDGYELAAAPVLRAGIRATKVDVLTDGRPQPPRRLADILNVLSALPDQDRTRAGAVFEALAQAEATVHGISPEDVHFHEVGAVDAIVDIVGAVAGLRMLGIEAVYVSPVPLGGGSARSAHGRIPVPAPATLALLAARQAPTRAGTGEPAMELLTPTGAAILTTLGTFERPAMRLTGWGNGAGSRDLPERPNVLRLLLGEAEPLPAVRNMVQIETNIDDMPGEAFGYAMERLLALGAADVWFTAIQMKKNRPAVLLSVLCAPELEAVMANELFRHTSTLGLRVRDVRRYEAAREHLTVMTSLGSVRVKVKRVPGEAPSIAPEYDDCRAIAQQTGLPILEVLRRLTAEAATQTN